MNEPMNDGGFAFPYVCQDISKYQAHEGGMSLRDYFAAAALTGMYSNASLIDSFSHHSVVVKEAFSAADAMLKERSKI
jgi:hypothetical protein